jgi:serine/threonine protein kinase
LQEVFQTPDYLFLVMDLYTGGNLLESYQFHSEAAAADIISHITNAVRYCHDRHIAVSTNNTAAAATAASGAGVHYQFAMMRAVIAS